MTNRGRPSTWRLKHEAVAVGTVDQVNGGDVNQPTTHELVLPLFAQPAGERRRYPTIVADPPWRIEMGPTLTQKGVKPRLEYPTMSQEELLQMPIGAWAQERAHLYLWCTNSTVPQAYELASAWGFKPSTLITWIKRRDPQDGWMGLGRYFRITTEHVLFAVRSGLEVTNKDQPNLIQEAEGLAFYAPRGRHSEKPSAFYDMVEHMSPGPYLDVFSRRQRFNWDTWGNEAFDFQEHGHWHDLASK